MPVSRDREANDLSHRSHLRRARNEKYFESLNFKNYKIFQAVPYTEGYPGEYVHEQQVALSFWMPSHKTNTEMVAPSGVFVYDFWCNSGELTIFLRKYHTASTFPRAWFWCDTWGCDWFLISGIKSNKIKKYIIRLSTLVEISIT